MDDNFDEVYVKMLEADDSDTLFTKAHKKAEKHVGKKYPAEYDSGSENWIRKNFWNSPIAVITLLKDPDDFNGIIAKKGENVILINRKGRVTKEPDVDKHMAKADDLGFKKL